MTSPRRPPAWTRSTANPFSGLWKVTRSMMPDSGSGMARRSQGVRDSPIMPPRQGMDKGGICFAARRS